jgi:phosphate transport system permease protein
MAFTMALTVILVLVVLWNALPVFWPTRVADFNRLVAVHDAGGKLKQKVDGLAEHVRAELASRDQQLGAVQQAYNAAWSQYAKEYDNEQTRNGGEVYPAKRDEWILGKTVAQLRGDKRLTDIGATIDEDGTIALDDGTRWNGINGATTLPDGNRVLKSGTVLLTAGARVESGGDIALAVLPEATIPLMTDGSDVPIEALNVTVPLLQGEQPPETGPEGATITTVGDDGRLMTAMLGEYVESQTTEEGVTSWKYKVGNREFGPSFRWVPLNTIADRDYPDDAFVLERMANLNFYGYLVQLETPEFEVSDEGAPIERVKAAVAAAKQMYDTQVEPLKDAEQRAADELQHTVKYELLDAEYRLKKLRRAGQGDSAQADEARQTIARLQEQEEKLKAASDKVTRERMELEDKVRANRAVFRTVTGQEAPIALVDIARPYCPNRMGFGQKVSHYLAKIWEMLSTDPREANQDGGLFPAIFGTVLMVFLMAISCFPLGVLAGIYLGEYAKEGPLVKIVRVAVNNLAGIPSIVYGIFGLGFFIYICGGTLDQLFFPARVDASEPVFGQGCILWASLTLGLLTIPVVIVATEEALRTIPRQIRESSYALGATKFQTLYRVLVPMASPGMMTGFILAMARAAGEVAPLMITGAVKIAPVPLDGTAPYLHLNQQFMHLGFHIFDISCKSPNVEATKPMVYVTTLLLLFIVLTMSSVAIWLRNSMQKKYYTRGI